MPHDGTHGEIIAKPIRDETSFLNGRPNMLFGQEHQHQYQYRVICQMASPREPGSPDHETLAVTLMILLMVVELDQLWLQDGLFQLHWAHLLAHGTLVGHGICDAKK